MSLRSQPKQPLSSSPAAPIEFKQEFASSTAALAASHDETVRNILSRLDSLQSKVAGTEEVRFAPETTASQPRSKPPASTTPAKPAAAASSPTELHARVSQLENIHQDHLQRLGAQLNAVESSLMDRGAENHTINEISAKFDRIEDHVRNAPDARTINEIAAKFDRIEGHVRNTAQLHDRIRSLESEVASLRSATIPHPEQERLLNKINERLDHWENSRAAAGKPTSTTLGARADTPVAGDRAEYLAARIDKLKELRSKYEG